MDPLYIEDTDDWLSSPTPLETCQYQLRMYESEFEELNLQLRKRREQIFNLVEMHASAATERDSLWTQLTAAREAVVEANRRATGAETKSAWELMAKTKHISELVTRLEAATGISVRTGQPLNR